MDVCLTWAFDRFSSLNCILIGADGVYILKIEGYWIEAKLKKTKKQTGIRVWVTELRLRWDKIQKLKFNIESKENFTQIGLGLRPYLDKIALFSFQNLFYFHIDVLLVAICWR